MAEAQLEPGTRSICEQCRSGFEARNRNGIVKRFCSSRCRDRHKNARRLQAAASLNHKKQRKHRGPDIALSLVPVEERAELLRLAAANLGITDRDRIEAALRRAGIPHYEATA